MYVIMKDSGLSFSFLVVVLLHVWWSCYEHQVTSDTRSVDDIMLFLGYQGLHFLFGPHFWLKVSNVMH